MATVEIGESAQLMFLKLSMDEKKCAQETLLDLAVGKITGTAAKPQNKKSKFEIKTPTSMVEVEEGSLSIGVAASK